MSALLRERAAEILRENDRGGYTIPSARLYPHQWNWDSAFCAIGWARIDPRRAASELIALVRGQWAQGMIPHILFNPAAAHYEPNPAAERRRAGRARRRADLVDHPTAGGRHGRAPRAGPFRR